MKNFAKNLRQLATDARTPALAAAAQSTGLYGDSIPFHLTLWILSVWRKNW
ncbi:MAG: hypothetical protein L3J98_10135 [Gammaproteobacteria bacterium]|nr:hypothetical protein [Gammaproteobacteria bacterium]MCF6260494.1 hypothetical protein [Gammaproteobacteria bacterium]